VIEPVMNRPDDLVHGVLGHLREPRLQAVDDLLDQSILFDTDDRPCQYLAATWGAPQLE
jgi:hypothetical protein